MPRLRENERNQLIGMIRGGVSVSTVAHYFNVTRRTVYVTLQRERATGSQKDRPRRLGRRKTTDREDTFIRLSHLRDRFKTAGQTTAEINNIRQNNPISKWTVFRRLKTFGLCARRPACRTRLTPYNIRNRLDWARIHSFWPRQVWNNHMFSDESKFLLERQDGRKRVFRRVNERFVPQCLSQARAFGGGSMMVWGGITAAGKTPLVTVHGNLTARRYIDEILRPHVCQAIHNQGLTFMQDNAPAHRARITNQFLYENNIPVLHPWPPYSPDLNPIEHLWDLLDRRVRMRQPQRQTLLQLERALHEEWDNIPQHAVQRLIGSMRRRCQAVILSRGHHTRY
ncbi:transposable element Tcb2 transposase [Elysia marginata]|uniref:Transposable element Tcb2 transposase n=1 Tax=Elysia marginata TaxID=1093978 RepID=A0AAV4GFH2_9GAST|nr:transposable element Tcb2 transposase [Elysia marginata]